MFRGGALIMITPGVFALVGGVAMLVFRRFAVWWASEGPMSRLSPNPPSRRTYEIAFTIGGIVASVVGVGLLIAAFLR